MARQVGLLKLTGTLGDISFYKSVYGYLARTKTGVARKTILTDPRFQRTLENASEFGHSARAGKLIRVAFRSLIAHAKDRMMVQRLTKEMVKVVQSDPINRRGLRKVLNGEMNILKGFDFNSNGKLDSTFFGSYETEFDRVTGIGLTTFSPFTPLKALVAPEGTTHFKLSMAVALLDFDALKFSFATTNSGMLSYNTVEIPGLVLNAELTPNSTFPVIQVLGISFFQFVNGEYCFLQNSEHNALGVVGVF